MGVSPGYETRELLSSVVPYTLQDVGSSPFVVSYCVNLERLSVQAHATADAAASAGASSVPLGGVGGGAGDVAGGGCGEYVVDAFLEDEDRIRAMIRTLLALELWRTRVLFNDGGDDDDDDGGQCLEEEEEGEVEFEVEGGSRLDGEYDALNDVDGGEVPSSADNINNEIDAAVPANDGGLAPRLAANGNVLRAAFVLHAETTIVSVLGLIFYRGVPPGLVEGDDGVLLSLIDYCARQLVSFQPSWCVERFFGRSTTDL